MTESRRLGIDFGTKRIGVALQYGTLAEPLIVLPNDATIWDTLRELCDQYEVTELIVGVSEKEMAELSTEFARDLSAVVSIPFQLVDETLSSEEVKKKLHESRPNKAKYTGPIDHYAAAVILQKALDEEL